MQRRVDELSAENELQALVLLESHDKRAKEELRKDFAQSINELSSLKQKHDQVLQKIQNVNKNFKIQVEKNKGARNV